MSSRLSDIADRHLHETIESRRSAFPVVVLAGARAVGKSTLLRQVAADNRVSVIDFDDLDTRALAASDPATFASGPAPVCIDEFQHVPEILDAIKAELNRRGESGRFLLTGSTRYDALPRTAQSLTGRATVVPVWPLSQGEIEGRRETCVSRLLAEPFTVGNFSGGTTEREGYVDRILAGGFPQPLALLPQMRPQWFADYITLVCERDVVALSKIRQREELPRLLNRLAAQTSQLLNVAEAARLISLDKSTTENYTRLMETVFLLHRLPAWGTGMSAKSGAVPKVHMVDTGIAGHLMNITEAKLAERIPAVMTKFGQLVETFVVNEVLKQLSWLSSIVTVGHWRDRGGAEVDLIIEQQDGSVIGIEVKSASRTQVGDITGLRKLADRLPGQWKGGIVFYTGQHVASLDQDRNILALPIDALWQ